MKKNIFRIFLFLIISILSFSAVYDIYDLNVEAELQKDGSAIISETVTYDITEINGVHLYIDAKDYGGITSLEVFEDYRIDKNGKVSYKKLNPSEYEIEEDKKLYKVTIHSKNKNNVRVFRFVYTLPDAINIYDDVAQFNRKMVGKKWEQNIKYVTVTIKLPVSEDYDNSKFLAFGHGPLKGKIDKIKNTVVYRLDGYRSGKFVEAHILMEPEIFSEFNKSKVIHENKKQELLDMEKIYADKANAKREKIKKIYELAKYVPKFGTIILAFITLWIFKIKRSTLKIYEKDITFGKYSREIPKLSPAVAGLIMTKNINNNEVLATILDLVRKKILSLETVGNSTFLKRTGKSNKSLSEAEKIILSIYINDFGDGMCLDLDSLKYSAKEYLYSEKVTEKFLSWGEIILNTPIEEGLKNIKLSDIAKNRKTLISLRVILAIIGLGGVFLAYFNPWMLILTPLAIPGIVLYRTPFPNKEKHIIQKELSAFKNFLSDYSQLEESKITNIYLWEEYFVYAVALGVSKKVLKAYKKALDIGVIKDDSTQFSDNLISSLISTIGNTETLDTIIAKNLNQYYPIHTREDQTKEILGDDSIWSDISSAFGDGGGFSSDSSGGGGSDGGGGAF